MFDSRETGRHAFVVGYPVKHSRSPLIHGYWLRQFGIDGSYRTVEVTEADFPVFLERLRDGSAGYSGGNVTIPHKERAVRLADRPDALSEELGAANTLWVEDGLVHSTNTDGLGFLANLDERKPGWDCFDKAVVLGAGGASRAIIQALRNRGLDEIHVVNRTVERAEELADRFGKRVFAHPMGALAEVLTGAGLFVNTTSLGMHGTPVPDFPLERLKSDATVTDIVYVPLVTPFLLQAERHGLATIDGLGMLLHQAVPGFEKWFGRRPQVTPELRALVIADMEMRA
ncbi:MAG: shikimate dehydrogenase [Rhizobiaceae bacterium]|nr:shikimate dehydrogenase [Rhizobiaceae bacterium]